MDPVSNEPEYRRSAFGSSQKGDVNNTTDLWLLGFRCQVSGVRKDRIMNTDLVETAELYLRQIVDFTHHSEPGVSTAVADT